MDEEGPNDRDLLEFIAARVESMNDQMATKTDMAELRTDLSELRSEVVDVRAQMATKTDVAELRTDFSELGTDLSDLRSEFADVRARMATKAELEAGFTAVRGDIERVAVRVDNLERSIVLRVSSVQTDVSRLRSVVYLLVKDQPDLVQLLGSDPQRS